MDNTDTNNKPVMLLVEDEYDTVDLIKLIMEEEGYQVVHAADGVEALEKIALMPLPSLVVLDIQLPKIDGITVLDTIRTNPDWQAVPVIILTAVSDADRFRQIIALKVQDYILKPFKRDSLVRSITRHRRSSSRPS